MNTPILNPHISRENQAHLRCLSFEYAQALSQAKQSRQKIGFILRKKIEFQAHLHDTIYTDFFIEGERIEKSHTFGFMDTKEYEEKMRAYIPLYLRLIIVYTLVTRDIIQRLRR